MPEIRRPAARRPGHARLLWGATLTGLYLLTAILAPLLAPYDYDDPLDPAGAKMRPPGTRLQAVALETRGWRLAERVSRTPDGLEIESRGKIEIIRDAEVINLTPDGVADSRFYLMGSDQLGRDLFSRILIGARVSLEIALLAVFLSLTLGVAVGALAATCGPLVDGILMRGVDTLLAVPSLFLLLALAGIFRPGAALIALILGLLGWMPTSRLVRAEIQGLMNREFVLAARASGSHPLRIFFQHLLPNALNPVLVQVPLLVGTVILAEASLSYIGFGVQPPTPTWGGLVADGWISRSGGWWSYTFPGVVLALTILSFNFLADGLREALDPRARSPRA